MALRWDESMRTGDLTIDTQHRKALLLVDRLEKATVECHDDPELVLAALERVMDFTIEHFVLEEHLMVRLDYPSAHQKNMLEQHRVFTTRARRHVLDFRDGRLVSALPLAADIAEWLTDHEFGLDKKFVDWVREHYGERGLASAHAAE